MNWHVLLYSLADIAIYSVAGFILLAVGIALVVVIVPFSIKREIQDEQNLSLTVLMGTIILGLSIIIASVVHSPAGLVSPWQSINYHSKDAQVKGKQEQGKKYQAPDKKLPVLKKGAGE